MKTVLLVMDLINDIAHPKGKIARSSGYIEKHQVIDKANRLIKWARGKDIPIGFVTLGFSKGYPECPKHSPIFGKAIENQALQLGE